MIPGVTRFPPEIDDKSAMVIYDNEMAHRAIWVWRIHLDRQSPSDEELQAILQPAERYRAESFLQPRHRLEYVRSHAALRILLAHVTGERPANLKFRVASMGKPVLDVPQDIGLDFSLSRSHGAAFVGISSGGNIGVDVERRSIPDHLEIARHWFAAEEIVWLETLPVGERERRFLECWTRKEAYLKALGVGLYGDLKACRCSLGANGVTTCEIADPGNNWSLIPLDDDESAACAIVNFKPAEQSIFDFIWEHLPSAPIF